MFIYNNITFEKLYTKNSSHRDENVHFDGYQMREEVRLNVFECIFCYLSDFGCKTRVRMTIDITLLVIIIHNTYRI